MILHYMATTYLLRKRIYNDGYYFIILIITMAAGIGLCALYGTIVPRYALAAGVVMVLAWIWRRDIQSFMQMLRSGRRIS